MKNIIKRSLPLDVKYSVIDKKYIPVLDGGGCSCDNCGKLIANIATITNGKEVFNIGFDCLETVLMNNSLIENYSLPELNNVKKSINKIIRFSKKIKEAISNNPHSIVTGLLFEKPSYDTGYITFYYLLNNSTSSRDNDYVKLNDVDFDFMIDTIKNIFPKLTIIVK